MSVHNKSGGTLNTKQSSTYVHINLVFKKNDNNNDKLQYLPKSLISQKYKKYSPTKYALLLYLAVAIRLVSIMFDAPGNSLLVKYLTSWILLKGWNVLNT